MPRPLVMGIINVTPDSFSDGGKHQTLEAAIAHGISLAEQGADVLDIGGESTRPGALPVPAIEEIRRVVPVIEKLASRLSIPISVDTSKARVAELALKTGASIVNDVTALSDPAMAGVIAKHKARVILMHSRGNPQTMQKKARYRDVVEEVKAGLETAIGKAQAAGIASSRILIDPGLGFAKTARHNLRLLRNLNQLASLGFPIVIGPSRKSFLGKILDVEMHDRLSGTLACVAWGYLNGAAMVRVHDVKPAVHVLTILQAIGSS